MNRNDFGYKQYEIVFPHEYTVEIVQKMSGVMGINVNMDLLNERMRNNGEPGNQCVAVFRHQNDKKSFIVVDCRNADWLYGIVVRCSDEIYKSVKEMLLTLAQEIRREYGQELLDDLGDSIEWKGSLLNRIRKTHGLKEEF